MSPSVSVSSVPLPWLPLLSLAECDHVTWLPLLSLAECDHVTWFPLLSLAECDHVTWLPLLSLAGSLGSRVSISRIVISCHSVASHCIISPTIQILIFSLFHTDREYIHILMISDAELLYRCPYQTHGAAQSVRGSGERPGPGRRCSAQT